MSIGRGDLGCQDYVTEHQDRSGDDGGGAPAGVVVGVVNGVCDVGGEDDASNYSIEEEDPTRTTWQKRIQNGDRTTTWNHRHYPVNNPKTTKYYHQPC